MGFSSGIYAYPKYKDLTYEDIGHIEHLLAYEDSPWAQKQFKNAEEYDAYCSNNYEEEGISTNYKHQPEDAVNFYREHLITDEYNYTHIYKNYASWCSNGHIIHDDIASELGKPAIEERDTGVRILSKADVAALFEYCLDKLERYMPVPASITHAYRYQRDEDGEISEDSDITLFKVDGFEVAFEDEEGDTSLKRIDTIAEYGETFAFPKVYCDEWEYGAYTIGLHACAKILGEVDFENTIVTYSGS